MKKTEKHISIGILIFAIFLFLCAVINLFSGHIGAAIDSLGAGIFFLCMAFTVEQWKTGKTKNRQL